MSFTGKYIKKAGNALGGVVIGGVGLANDAFSEAAAISFGGLAQKAPADKGVFNKVVDFSADISADMAIGATNGIEFIAGSEDKQDKEYGKNLKAYTVFWVDKDINSDENIREIEKMKKTQYDVTGVQATEDFERILNNSSAIVKCKK